MSILGKSSREIQERVFGIVVEPNGFVWLGKATEEKKESEGKIVGPTGIVFPGNDPFYSMIQYCYSDFGLSVSLDNIKLAARKKYVLNPSISDRDILVHVFVVCGYKLFPHDTSRVRDITLYSNEQVPYDRMFKDDIYLIPDVLRGEDPFLLTFESGGPDDNCLIGKTDLRKSDLPTVSVLA